MTKLDTASEPDNGRGSTPTSAQTTAHSNSTKPLITVGQTAETFIADIERERRQVEREELERAYSEALSLEELERFDPSARVRDGAECRFCCPECHGNRRFDSSHRCFVANLRTGEFFCHRCELRGKLREFWKFRPDSTPAPMIRAPRPAPATISDEQPDDRWRKWFAEAKPIQGTPATRYLLDHAVPVEIAVAADVKFSPWFLNGSVLFPICDQTGVLVGFESRAVGEGYEGHTKLSKGEKSKGVVFGPEDLDADRIAVVEAPITRMILKACGLPTIATCGAGNWPEWLTEKLEGKRVLLAYDNDEINPKTGTRPGDEGERRAVERLQGRCILSRFRPNGVKNWAKLAQSQGLEAVRVQVRDLLAGMEFNEDEEDCE